MSRAQGRGTPASSRWREVGLIGAGNMALALMRGFLRAGLLSPGQMRVSDVDATKRRTASRRLGVGATADNTALVRGSRLVILAVKPQSIDAVLDEIAAHVTSQNVFISIAAGVSTKRIESHLGSGTRVVRVMPNTPALLGRGVSVVVRGRWATATDERLALRLLRAVGSAVAIAEERLLDAVTGLSGSGPAYVYLFAEALIAGGKAAGLPAPLAYKLALETIVGAAHMLTDSGEPPPRLRAMVSSPGGTTLAGLSELERRGFSTAVIAGVRAATKRSRELGRG